MNVQAALLIALVTGWLGEASTRTASGPLGSTIPPTESCIHELSSAELTKKNRDHYRPFLDTTIVRTQGCTRHVLILPSRSTVTSYLIVDTRTNDTVLNDSFAFTGSAFAWDITHISGIYKVRMGACHMAGDFNLTIR